MSNDHRLTAGPGPRGIGAAVVARAMQNARTDSDDCDDPTKERSRMTRPAPSPSPSPSTAPDAATVRPAVNASGAPLRILLAEADDEMRRLLALVLRSDGHDIVEVTEGSALLEAIASLVIVGARPFDLIMSAQAIPGLPGSSVLAGLRSRGRRTPFVLMTGNPVVQAQATRLGAVVLDRPFDAEAIRRAVRRADALAQGTL
jgi:CheY-like chemotaxis protein